MNGKGGLSNRYPQGIHMVAIAEQIHFTNLTSYRVFPILHTTSKDVTRMPRESVSCSVPVWLPLVVSRGITDNLQTTRLKM